MQSPKTSVVQPSRRGFVAGSVTLGAAAAATVALPVQAVPRVPAAEASAASKPERGGGYRLSEHVKRYYKTTLL